MTKTKATKTKATKTTETAQPTVEPPTITTTETVEPQVVATGEESNTELLFNKLNAQFLDVLSVMKTLHSNLKVLQKEVQKEKKENKKKESKHKNKKAPHLRSLIFILALTQASTGASCLLRCFRIAFTFQR